MLLVKEDKSKKQRLRWKKKFLYYFPKGFHGEKYKSWERDYKWEAHLRWEEQLNKKQFQALLAAEQYSEIANTVVKIETKTNLLFSFEKMAIRDGIKSTAAAKKFSEGLFQLVYGNQSMKNKFENFTDTLASLPRKQTRVVTWPLQTVFGFIAEPSKFIFLKPVVTKTAAAKYGFDFNYKSQPNWQTYQSLIEFAELVRTDLADLGPVDFIDMQSFIWVLGSDEYPD